MLFCKRYQVSITTDASGDGTGATPKITGRVMSVHYGGQFDATADLTCQSDVLTQNIWVETDVAKAAKVIAPRQPTHDYAGVASLVTGGGQPVEDYIVLADEAIEVTVAQGGNAVTGTVTFVIG